MDKKNVKTSIDSVLSNLDSLIFPNHSLMNNERKTSIKKVIAEIDESGTYENGDSDNICKVCGKEIDKYTFYSLRKSETTHLKHIITECKNFCSKACLETFSDNNKDTIDEYELHEVRRCSGYYDCLDLDNLRGMCERPERLDCEESLFALSNGINFCEPADAGIIKASINIKRQIDEGSKQNSIHFKLTVLMTVLVIILTILNTYLIFATNYENQLDNIDEKLGSINNILASINNQIETINFNSNTDLIDNNLLDVIENSNQTTNLLNQT